MNQIALQMIESALDQLIRIGRRIENLQLIVSAESALTQRECIHTAFGELQIVVGQYVPKGYSYIMEISTGGRPRAFRWVSRPIKKKGGNKVA
jgi:hypothetical protein